MRSLKLLRTLPGILLLAALFLMSAETAAACGCGCTPGFWKNHPEAWSQYAAFKVGDVFTLPSTLSSFNVPLLQALDGGGGPGVEGAATILLRAAVAAYLNKSILCCYPYTVPQIQTKVNAALASLNRETMLMLATTLDGYNNGCCPL